MTKFIQISILLVLAAFEVACSHSAYIPNTPHQLPIVSGRRWGGKAGFDFASAAAVPIFSEIGSNPPRRAQGREVGTVMGAGSALDLGLGIFENVDLYYTTAFGARWQFYGMDKVDPWRATVFAGGISGRANGTSIGTEGNPEYLKAETRLGGTEFGSSVGYQHAENVLLYGTIVYRKGKGDSTVTQAAGIFEYSDNYSLLSMVAGVHFGTTWYLDVEAGFSSVDWQNATSGPSFASNIGFGYNW